MPRLSHALFISVAVSLNSIAIAAGGGGESTEPKVEYVEVKPAFITNFGTPGTKLRYIKAEVSLRVFEPGAKDAVTKHMPLIRHHLLRMLGAQSETNINDIETQEKLRADALVKLKEVIKAEENHEYIEDLLFTSFVTQM